MFTKFHLAGIGLEAVVTFPQDITLAFTWKHLVRSHKRYTKP